MNINRKFLGLVASFLLALVFTFSCSDDTKSGGGGSGGTIYDQFTGTWNASGDRSIVFAGNTFNYKVTNITMYSGTFSVSGSTITFNATGLGTASGNFTLSAGTLILQNHTWDNSVNGTYTKDGGASPTPPPSNGQYCAVAEDGGIICALIGTDPRCYVYSTAECQNRYQGTTTTLAWCNTNSDLIYVCDKEEEGYCLYPSGYCDYGYTQSECISDGGIFNLNSCPSVNPSSSSKGGNNSSSSKGNNSSSSGGGSNGQYCYDSDYEKCFLIGTDDACYIYSTAECLEFGGTLKTSSWCNANLGASDIWGCDYGVEGYCLWEGQCFNGISPTVCNMLGGTFNENSCPADPALPSNGQYCYDGEEYCDLIGTSDDCYVSSTTECTQTGGSVKTFTWCSANADITAGCIYGDYSYSVNPLSKQSSNIKSLRKSAVVNPLNKKAQLIKAKFLQKSTKVSSFSKPKFLRK